MALVMIGLISQQIETETSQVASGPKFVSPNAEKHAEPEADGLTISSMIELAMNAARDMLGSGPDEPPKSSLEQLRSRSSS